MTLDTLDALNEEVTQKLKKQRIQKGLSQADLARELQKQGVKIHQSAIAKLENGGRRLEIALAMRMADILDLDWQELHIAQENTHDQALSHTLKATRAAINTAENLNAANAQNLDTIALLGRALQFAQQVQEQSEEDYDQLRLETLKVAASELTEALQHAGNAIAPAVDVAHLAASKLETLNTHLVTSHGTK